MTSIPQRATITSLLLLVLAGCSNPSSTEMVGKWQLNCSEHPTMNQSQINDIANVNTVDLTVDADSFFFRSVRGTTSLSNWRYGYKVLNINNHIYDLEAAIKGKIVTGLSVEVIANDKLVFGKAWYDDQLIPPTFNGCSFSRSY
jgi:hypothetical protein